ncbi:MAG TPA: hypothetical protein DCZ91_21295 [Lachnospiraceae bacterium]|nr:hypothetical protein [Lachnospiraceae bacterium]
MEALFLKVFNMGIAAGWVILAVLLLRFFLRKAPRSLCCILWALAAARLVCPIFLESGFSLIPSAEAVPREILTMQEPAVESGFSRLDNRINMAISDSMSSGAGDSANPMQVIVWAAARLWAAGAAAMLLYSVVTWCILRRRVTAALRTEENIWICDAVKSPFILGILSPHIYLPSDLAEPELGCVVAHEKAHLKRHDHWWKPFGFLLLSLYWFHPLCWIAYILFCQDMELACDERVIREMGDAEKKNYAEALLACSIPRHMVSACPVAFGEAGVKKRIKSVLNYRKPAFWVMGMAAAACAIAAICFLTNPSGGKWEQSDADKVELRRMIQAVDKKVAYVFAVYENDRVPGKLLAGFTNSSGQIGYAVFEQNSTKGEAGYRLKGCRPLGEELLENDTLGLYWGFDRSVTVVLSRNQNLAYVEAKVGEETLQAENAGNLYAPSMLVLEWPRLLKEDVEVHYYNQQNEEMHNPEPEELMPFWEEAEEQTYEDDMMMLMMMEEERRREEEQRREEEMELQDPAGEQK